jgi:signal transduction histidine kinase
MTAAWGRLSLRARLLTIGVAGVATALALGSIALYTVLTLVTYRTLDQAGVATAREVAELVVRDRLPDPIPVTGSQVVQVVDARDRVVSASVNADRLTSLLVPRELPVAASGERVEVPGARVGSSTPLRVIAVSTGAGADRRYVVVAQEFDDIAHSQRVLRTTLLVTYPLLLAVLALLAWRVVGAALRPVEALRRSAELISGTEQDTRLPVPVSGDEIHRLAETLNSMLDRLAVSRARQRSFVADAAHELRSPLASMQTQLEVSRRLGEDLPGVEDLHAEVRRMVALVEDLLVLARLQDDVPRSPAVEAVDLVALVEGVVARAAGGRVPVRSAPVASGTPPPLVADARRDEVERAVRNLVDNAVRHAQSVVDVTVGDDGTRLVIEVCDDGAGILPEDRERVFERFTRLDEGRARDSGGSGLGLAIARELVRRSGGEVQLGTSAAGGLAARVLLPRRRDV